jgi:stress response protein YsnF
MGDDEKDVVIPVVHEEVQADAVPVVTGGVRVTKRVEGHDEVIEQELRKSRVEVKRVKTDRAVDGPQPVQRVGNTLIVPVVSEVLRVEKQWVVTEEIHITELQERETVQNKVRLNHEEAQVERLDSAGEVVSRVDDTSEARRRGAPASILETRQPPGTASRKRPLSASQSILEKRQKDRE